MAFELYTINICIYYMQKVDYLVCLNNAYRLLNGFAWNVVYCGCCCISQVICTADVVSHLEILFVGYGLLGFVKSQILSKLIWIYQMASLRDSLINEL